MKKNHSLKSILVIVCICLVIAVAMAAINLVTAPKIEEANEKAEKEALRIVLEDAMDFEKVEGEYPEAVTAVYRDTGNGGYVTLLSAKGYDSSNPMKIAVGFDANGNILKCHVISCNGETSGLGTKVSNPDFLNTFVGADASLSGVDTISGATISSSAMIGAVRDAFDAVSLAMEVQS